MGGFLKSKTGDFPGGPVIKTQTSTAEGTGSLPGSQILTSMAWPKN